MFLAFSTHAGADSSLISRPVEAVEENATTTEADDAATPPKPDLKTSEPELPSKESNDNATSMEEAKRIPIAPDALQILSNLRTTLEIRTLEVSLAKQDKMLRELTMPTILPGSLVKQNKQGNSKPKSREPRPKVVAVQGIGGKLSAVLLDKNGTLKVQEGDKIGSGIVTSITPDRVMVKYGKTEIPLSFKE